MSQADPSHALVAELDQLLLDAERQQRELQRALARAHGREAEQLAIAWKQLDSAIQDWRAKRDALRERLARTKRMGEITAELRSLRGELEPLAVAGTRNERYHELRARADALLAEASRLKA